MINNVTLIGRLGNDPELKYTPSGVAVANFRLAVPRGYKKGDEQETDWIDIVAWRQTAEYCANYLNKGRLVAVVGRIQTRSWTAQDGTKRKAVEVVADKVTGLDKPKQGAGEAPEQGESGEAVENYDPYAEE